MQIDLPQPVSKLTPQAGRLAQKQTSISRKNIQCQKIQKQQNNAESYLCSTHVYPSFFVEERNESAYVLLNERFGTGMAMARRSNIEAYERRLEIDVALAAGVPHTIIAERHPFSRFCIGRYRSTLMRQRRDYWRSLRKVCLERGLDKHSILKGGHHDQ